MSVANVTSPAHPYYPVEAVIVGYLANEWNTLELCSMFAAGCAAIFSVTFLVVKRVRPSVPVSDLVTILWFVLCQ
jgi:cholestenol Delta-isomerase